MVAIEEEEVRSAGSNPSSGQQACPPQEGGGEGSDQLHLMEKNHQLSSPEEEVRWLLSSEV